MRLSVPQFVDIEDKIAFQLTFKQLGWFGTGGAFLFFAWKVFVPWAFWVSLIFTVLFCVAFAFVKIHGMTLWTYIVKGIFHGLRPKILVWKRVPKEIEVDKDFKKKMEKDKNEKRLILEKAKQKEKKMSETENLANILDKESDL